MEDETVCERLNIKHSLCLFAGLREVENESLGEVGWTYTVTTPIWAVKSDLTSSISVNKSRIFGCLNEPPIDFQVMRSTPSPSSKSKSLNRLSRVLIRTVQRLLVVSVSAS